MENREMTDQPTDMQEPQQGLSQDQVDPQPGVGEMPLADTGSQTAVADTPQSDTGTIPEETQETTDSSQFNV